MASIIDEITSGIQKSIGKMADKLTNDLKIKTFGSLTIRTSPCKVTIPEIRVTSNGLKVKVIDKSPAGKGKAILDKPIDINIHVPSQDIVITPAQIIKYEPKIDVMIGGKE